MGKELWYGFTIKYYAPLENNVSQYILTWNDNYNKLSINSQNNKVYFVKINLKISPEYILHYNIESDMRELWDSTLF